MARMVLMLTWWIARSVLDTITSFDLFRRHSAFALEIRSYELETWNGGLTGRSRMDEALAFLDDKESRLGCSFGDAFCSSHLQTTVNCVVRADPLSKLSARYEKEARRKGDVRSLVPDLGPGGMKSKSESWACDGNVPPSIAVVS